MAPHPSAQTPPACTRMHTRTHIWDHRHSGIGYLQLRVVDDPDLLRWNLHSANTFSKKAAFALHRSICSSCLTGRLRLVCACSYAGLYTSSLGSSASESVQKGKRRHGRSVPSRHRVRQASPSLLAAQGHWHFLVHASASQVRVSGQHACGVGHNTSNTDTPSNTPSPLERHSTCRSVPHDTRVLMRGPRNIDSSSG